ncbi:MAG: hypothetical protein EOO02_23475 [Chitinophagaceae bacterium]|nr:MAG: hypothetical protein EOO02_23475 [Chitinophagaceae bacterium]
MNGKRTSEPTVAHEIAHQWFGDMATEVDFSHLWLSEGFATFMTMFYMESKYGKDTADKLLAVNRQQVIDFASKNPKPVVDSSVKSYMELLNANSYQKGGWVLHMLRQKIGDSLFQQTLRAYYQQYKGKNAVTEDFQKVAETISKQDLKQFFQQWLYTGGIPQLNVKWSLVDAGKKLKIQIRQVQSAAPYQFALTSFIKGEGDEMQVAVFDITEADQEFLVPLKMRSKPVSFELDPLTTLLFEEKK